MPLKAIKSCEICGKGFHPHSNRPGHGRFCSKPCKGVWMRGNRPANTTHGLSGSPTMKTYEAMVRRCTLPRDKDYPDYGGRGIEVCTRWLNSFPAFVEDMGVRPAGMSIGRIDNEGNYEPNNCRWETYRQQNNNRRSTRRITFQGRTQSIAQWARELGTHRQTIRYRIENGWPLSAALTTPINHANRRP